MRRSVALILMVLTVLLLGYGDEVPFAFKSRKLIDYLGEMFQASSILEEEEQDYRMQNLFDGYAGSAWVEGKEGAGLGESLILAVPRGADTLALVNGFARSSSLYLKNNRIKELSLTVEFSRRPCHRTGAASVYYPGLSACHRHSKGYPPASDPESLPSLGGDRQEKRDYGPRF
jgi:hypothetical protein